MSSTLLEDKKLMLLWSMANREIKPFLILISDPDFRICELIDEHHSVVEMAALLALNSSDDQEYSERKGYLGVTLSKTTESSQDQAAIRAAIALVARRGHSEQQLSRIKQITERLLNHTQETPAKTSTVLRGICFDQTGNIVKPNGPNSSGPAGG